MKVEVGSCCAKCSDPITTATSGQPGFHHTLCSSSAPHSAADLRAGGEEAGEHHGGGQPDQEQAAAGGGRAAPRAGGWLKLRAGSAALATGRQVLQLAGPLPLVRSLIHITASRLRLAPPDARLVTYTHPAHRWSWRRRSSSCRPSAVSGACAQLAAASACHASHPATIWSFHRLSPTLWSHPRLPAPACRRVRGAGWRAKGDQVLAGGAAGGSVPHRRSRC